MPTAKRGRVHEVVFARVRSALAEGARIVVDATVHEAPPEAYDENREFLDGLGCSWQLRVLHPALEVAIARDAGRAGGSLGAERVTRLHAKFTGMVFAGAWLLDTSRQTPEETVASLLRSGCA